MPQHPGKRKKHRGSHQGGKRFDPRKGEQASRPGTLNMARRIVGGKLRKGR